MIRRAALVVGLLITAAAVLAAPGRRDVVQEVPRLTWITPGFMPPDGLITAGIGMSYLHNEYDPTGSPAQFDVLQMRLFADWTPWTGVALSWGQNLRSWSNYQPSGSWPSADAGASGMGLADGDWRLAVALPGTPRWLGASVWGGSNLPVGSEDLGEGALSPEAGGTVSLRFWQDSPLPELRLHASLGRRWNRNEDEGYGVHLGPGVQVWYPQYPDAASSGGEGNNDFRFWGVGLEFRATSTALWLEYTEQQLWRADQVWPREDQKLLSAGLRWGLEEGWALHNSYQVSFTKDEPWFTDYYPAVSDIGYHIAISRQFGAGGRDQDGDGIPDRRDACRDEAEDLDGYRDEDGCPDPDNDGDGIPDVIDLAPDEPEDFDGYFDEDGIPEPDNDGDGIPDGADRCPDEPEDFDGYKDGDGCPEEFIDADGDGIADEDDLCPDSPEDLDGFEDQDGCPDPDNDLDGIPDAEDACPDEAEDYDGDADGDGCPDGVEEPANEPEQG